jgi:hypothetical protein
MRMFGSMSLVNRSTISRASSPGTLSKCSSRMSPAIPRMSLSLSPRRTRNPLTRACSPMEGKSSLRLSAAVHLAPAASAPDEGLPSTVILPSSFRCGLEHRQPVHWTG